MRKGFTLMELMGIIVLLGIIIVVAVPSIIKSNKNALAKEKEEFKIVIQTACESYVQVKLGEDSTWSPEGGKIKAVELVEEGYLNGNMKNPNSDKTIAQEDKTISVSMGSQITCTYNN